MKGSMKFILFVGTISLALTQHANQKQIAEAGIMHPDTLKKEVSDNTTVKVDTMGEKIEDIKYDKYGVMAGSAEFPTLHPMVVNVAVLLILFAGLLQLLNVFLFKKDIAWIVFLLILAGLSAAIISSRNFQPYTAGLAERAAVIMGVHERLAEWTIRTAFLGLLLQIVHLFLTRFEMVLFALTEIKKEFSYRINRIFMVTIALIILTSAFCVFRAAHLGSQLISLRLS